MPCADPSRARASLLLVAAALLVGACSPPRAFEAAGLLVDLMGGPDPDATATGASGPERLSLPVARPGETAGDLYWPTREAAAALVLVPGVVPEGKDDPRLVTLARALADVRFAVLVPEIPNLRAQQVSPADADAIAAALQRFAACFEPAPGGALGLVAISYAAGPAVLAALQPAIRDRVRYLVAIGGYYDLEAVVTFFTTGHFRVGPEEPWRHRTPNAYGKWVFVRANAERLADPADQAALAAMAERKLEDLAAPIDDLRAGLGPEGRAVMALLDNRDPDRVPALIAGLPEVVRADLAALDVKRRDLADLGARLLLIHGRDDPIIPASESQALAAAAPASRASLYLVDSLAHVELGFGGLADAFGLWRAAYELLAERDAAPAPDRDNCLMKLQT